MQQTDTDADVGADGSYPDHLDVDRFENPVTFRVTTDPEGKETLLPFEIETQLLAEKFDLSESQYDTASGGLDEDERFWRYYAFERDAVDDPERVIEAAQKLLDNYNTPPEALDEEARAEWRQATVIITDI